MIGRVIGNYKILEHLGDGGLEQDSIAAGRELRVESVLDGQIQRWGDRIRITARLIAVSEIRNWRDLVSTARDTVCINANRS